MSKRLPTSDRAVSLDSRLVQDLGIDGEEAIEFFEAYDKEFQVDLSLLIDQSWQRHFGPKGGVHWSIVAGFFVCYLVASALDRWVGHLPQWVWYLATILTWAGLLRLRPFARSENELVPITVRDLVEAAQDQRWSKAC